MIAEYRNNMYIVSGFQLSEISTIVDALTVVRHALHGESVSREVIGGDCTERPGGYP